VVSFRRVNDTAAQAYLESRDVTDVDVALAEAVAAHCEGATVDGAVARVGLGDVSISCEAAAGTETASGWAVPLFFRLWGGLLGPAPVAASISGYATTRAEAVAEGGSLWAGSYAPVLRAGLAGLPDADPELRVLAARLQGTPVRVAYAPLGRVMSARALSDREQADALAATRTALTGGRSLTAALLDWRGLPLVDLRHSALVSTLVLDGPQGRTVEVKVHGEDIATEGLFPDTDPPADVCMLRELAVVTRIGQRTG
jgi:hypothetical protein